MNSAQPNNLEEIIKSYIREEVERQLKTHGVINTVSSSTTPQPDLPSAIPQSNHQDDFMNDLEKILQENTDVTPSGNTSDINTLTKARQYVENIKRRRAPFSYGQ